MDNSRRCNRASRQTNKSDSQIDPPDELARLASTPIVSARTEPPPAFVASPRRPRLPDLNVSRVGLQHGSPRSPCSPIAAALASGAFPSGRRLSTGHRNASLVADHIAHHLNVASSDNFTAYSDRMIRLMKRKRHLSNANSVRLCLAQKFEEINDEDRSSPIDAKHLKLDFDTNDEMDSPMLTRSAARAAHIELATFASDYSSPLSSDFDNNRNKIMGTPNSRPHSRRRNGVISGTKTPPEVVPLQWMDVDLRTPQSSSPDELASSKPGSDSSPSKEVRNQFSMLSVSPSYAPVKTPLNEQREHFCGLDVSSDDEDAPAADNDDNDDEEEDDGSDDSSNSGKPKGRDWSQLPFHSMSDSDLRFIQACASAVLSANHAREEYVEQRLDCSINQFVKTRISPISRSNKNLKGQQGNSGASGQLSNSACAPQANGDDKTDTPSPHFFDLTDYPSYRFCTEFVKHERLENSRFGLVFAARNRIDGLLYCVKKSRGPGDALVPGILNMRHIGPTFAEARQELLQEARALSALRVHDNIVRYFSTWLEYDCVYIQLEFCNGGSLKDLLRLDGDRRIVSKPYMFQLLGDIGSALSFVHRQGMLHLDLTPGNILISSPAICNNAGNYGSLTALRRKRRSVLGHLTTGYKRVPLVFKLADFGRCRSKSQPKVLEDVGDAEYMPPEVFGSVDGEVDPSINLMKIDVYSFGLCCFYSMGGARIEKRPFDTFRSFRRAMFSRQVDKNLLKFVVTMLGSPAARPTVSQILDYQGVCEASSSRECLERRIIRLKSK